MPESSKKPVIQGGYLTKRQIGRVLVDAGFITEKDLQAALKRQATTSEPMGGILVSLGLLDEAALKAVLSIQRDLATLESAIKTAAGSPQRLGELLVRAGRATNEDIASTLEEQKKTKERLGRILVRRGLVSEKELEAVIAFQQSQTDADRSGRCRLGEILVSANYITREQLDQALRLQKASPAKKLGAILVDAGHIKPAHVEHALHIQHKLTTAALVASLILAEATPMGLGMSMAYAAQQSKGTTVSIGAIVKAYASAKMIHQMQELVITQADVTAGYVDAPLATTMEIKTNSDTGYLVSFNGLVAPFMKIYVRGLQNEAQIIHDGGWVIQTGPASRGLQTLQLSYRFVLDQGVETGTYAWPLNISVQPL